MKDSLRQITSYEQITVHQPQSHRQQQLNRLRTLCRPEMVSTHNPDSRGPRLRHLLPHPLGNLPQLNFPVTYPHNHHPKLPNSPTSLPPLLQPILQQIATLEIPQHRPRDLRTREPPRITARHLCVAEPASSQSNHRPRRQTPRSLSGAYS